tara:strand:- start:2265 stop:2603 length:339 start_codon:yes stop_codon:yes gene_type:complete
MHNLGIEKYKSLTHTLFILFFTIKFINVIEDRIELILFLAWLIPLIIFYYFINNLMIRAYQWFCFFLLIYFLFASLKVFGTNAYWLDTLELIWICFLFIHIMYGPKTIKNIN